MYLEISGRQTGKTKRIIDHARKLIASNIEPIIVGLRIGAYPRDLQPYFRRKLHTYTQYLLCDEFEYQEDLDSILNNLQGEKDLVKDWYIVGTPIYKISYNLKALLTYQPWYIRHGNYIFEQSMYKKLNEYCRNELQGEFKDD